MLKHLKLTKGTLLEKWGSILVAAENEESLRLCWWLHQREDGKVRLFRLTEIEAA